MRAVALVRSGMVTGLGFDADATCAAIRGGIDAFRETRFAFGKDWIVGSEVPFEERWRGREKLLQMVIPAIRECLEDLPDPVAREIPLLLCVAEDARSGRFAGLGESFLRDAQERCGLVFHEQSRVIAGGRIAGVHALVEAREQLGRGRPYCIVAGVDSYLVTRTLVAFNKERKLQTSDNSDGFIPGEAGAACLLASAGRHDALLCEGIGLGVEPAPAGSGEPLRADGLTAAIQAAFADAGLGYEQLDFRICDASGGQYGFKEASLALARTMRVRKEVFDIWHPADCIGEIGAATVPVVLGVAAAAWRKNYAPGPGVLCHFASNADERAALVLRPPAAEAG